MDKNSKWMVLKEEWVGKDPTNNAFFHISSIMIRIDMS